jgi:site-specific DNA recombinase
MPSTNGYSLKRSVLWAILYARVSTDEQARSGYSLAQQLEALREYAAREGYEVLEEVVDAGQSGASLERPGMDRVRDLVAGGSVAVVLAQDRDRFAREPAYLFYLREEFAEHNTALRALNDRGDGSPEGELTTGILDQIARYERLKIAERSRRGKLRKAREGKVIATKRSHFGYRYNASRDGYEVDEETMAVVKRIFRMVGTEGVAIRGVKRIFEREGLPTPEGKKIWGQFLIREAIRDDAYRPHSWKEIERLVAKGQMAAEVASRLDPQEHYGIWWFNRRRTKTYQEAVSGPEGKRYKRRVKITPRPEEEWIAVPVPDSGIPREWIDLAREAIADNVKFSQNNNRPWELSGGIARCAECGWAMRAHSVRSGKSAHVNHYYHCSRVNVEYAYKSCANRKSHRADRLEPLVWDYVSGVMKNPEELRADLDRMIELERKGTRGDPGKEARFWAEKLAEVERKRAKYQEAFAADAVTLPELKAYLAQLDETRKTAEHELEVLWGHEEYVRELETGRDALLDSLEAQAPEALDSLTPEERHQWYKLLKLRADVFADGRVEISWAGAESGEAVCETTTLSLSRSWVSSFPPSSASST